MQDTRPEIFCRFWTESACTEEDYVWLACQSLMSRRQCYVPLWCAVFTSYILVTIFHWSKWCRDWFWSTCQVFCFFYMLFYCGVWFSFDFLKWGKMYDKWRILWKNDAVSQHGPVLFISTQCLDLEISYEPHWISVDWRYLLVRLSVTRLWAPTQSFLSVVQLPQQQVNYSTLARTCVLFCAAAAAGNSSELTYSCSTNVASLALSVGCMQDIVCLFCLLVCWFVCLWLSRNLLAVAFVFANLCGTIDSRRRMAVRTCEQNAWTTCRITSQGDRGLLRWINRHHACRLIVGLRRVQRMDMTYDPAIDYPGLPLIGYCRCMDSFTCFIEPTTAVTVASELIVLARNDLRRSCVVFLSRTYVIK